MMDSQQVESNSGNVHVNGGPDKNKNDDSNINAKAATDVATAAEKDGGNREARQQEQPTASTMTALTALHDSQSSSSQEQPRPQPQSIVGEQQEGRSYSTTRTVGNDGDDYASGSLPGGESSVAGDAATRLSSSSADFLSMPATTSQTEAPRAAAGTGSCLTTPALTTTSPMPTGVSLLPSPGQAPPDFASATPIPQGGFRNTIGNQTIMHSIPPSAASSFSMPSVLPYSNWFANLGGGTGAFQFMTIPTQQGSTNSVGVSNMTTTPSTTSTNVGQTMPMPMNAAASSLPSSSSDNASARAATMAVSSQNNHVYNGSINNNPHFLQSIANAVQGHQMGAMLLNNSSTSPNEGATAHDSNNPSSGAIAHSPGIAMNAPPPVVPRQPQQQFHLQFLSQPQQQLSAQPFLPIQLRIQPFTPSNTTGTSTVGPQQMSQAPQPSGPMQQIVPTSLAAQPQTSGTGVSNSSNTSFPFCFQAPTLTTMHTQTPQQLQVGAPTAASTPTPSSLEHLQQGSPPPTTIASIPTLTNAGAYCGFSQQPPQQQPVVQLHNVDAQQLLLLHNLIAASSSNTSAGSQLPTFQLVIPGTAFNSVPGAMTANTSTAMPSGVPGLFTGGEIRQQPTASTTTLKPPPQSSFQPQSPFQSHSTIPSAGTAHTVSNQSTLPPPATTTPNTSRATANDNESKESNHAVTMIHDYDDDFNEISTSNSGNTDGMAIIPLSTSQQKARKKKESRNSGAKIPCRARGMPPDHNHKTAHFTIGRYMKHGQELVCSYDACRDQGIKFYYCSFCGIPAARRNFRQRHNHLNESSDGGSCSDDSEREEMPATTKIIDRVDQSSILDTPSASVAGISTGGGVHLPSPASVSITRIHTSSRDAIHNTNSSANFDHEERAKYDEAQSGRKRKRSSKKSKKKKRKKRDRKERSSSHHRRRDHLCHGDKADDSSLHHQHGWRSAITAASSKSVFQQEQQQTSTSSSDRSDGRRSKERLLHEEEGYSSYSIDPNSDGSGGVSVT